MPPCQCHRAWRLGEMERNGFNVSYASTLLMVDNWLPNFDMNEQRKMLSQKHVEEKPGPH